VRNTLLTEAELPSSGNGMRSSLAALNYLVKKWLKLRDTGANKAKYYKTGTKAPPGEEWPAGSSGVVGRSGSVRPREIQHSWTAGADQYRRIRPWPAEVANY
jgi:hypothetical protein